MAKKVEQRVFGTVEEAQAAATQTEGKRRVFTVNGSYVVAADAAQALWFAYRGRVEGIDLVDLGALPSIDDALAALANATPEQKAAALKVLRK